MDWKNVNIKHRCHLQLTNRIHAHIWSEKRTIDIDIGKYDFIYISIYTHKNIHKYSI